MPSSGVDLATLDTLFERACTWCLESLPVESVRLGSE